MLVFIPLTQSQLSSWVEGGSFAPKQAFGVTNSLRQAFGFTPADDEEAEHTAMHIAGLSGLLSSGRRLVAVAEASARAVAGSEFGEVEAGAVPWSAVNALFADDASGAATAGAVDRPHASLSDAWDDPAIADLLASHELLWHGPSEWAGLVAG